MLIILCMNKLFPITLKIAKNSFFSQKCTSGNCRSYKFVKPLESKVTKSYRFKHRDIPATSTMVNHLSLNKIFV